jgi:peptidoglycan/xylan/chitin deacetylase (PgdA/CDA1 family)
MVPYRVRASVKSALTRALSSLSGLRNTETRFACLCYHSISGTRSYLSVDPSHFREQLQLLQSWGFQFATVGEVVAAIRSGGAIPQKTVAITFDDGYKDNAGTALPILSACGARATFYVTSGLAAGDADIIARFHGITHYQTEYLNGSDLRQLCAAGMEVGGHTHSHPNLARLGPNEVARELRDSRRWLEDQTGQAVDQFAFPYGKRGIHYTDATLRAVEACGYRGSACVEFHSTASLRGIDPFQIPRFFVTRDDSAASLKAKVDGAMNWLGWYQAHSPAWMKAALSPEDVQV